MQTRISLVSRVTAALAAGSISLACGNDGMTGAFESQSTGQTGTESDTASSDSDSDSGGPGTASASDSDSDGTTDGGPKYDVGDDGPVIPCDCHVEYVWIANSEESTVSKISTATLEEVGRYLTREDGAGNPSRTSVSLSGDVAVANRHSGLVKFYADQADCKDTNGIPGIQTSTGKTDVLPWAEEECRAWYTPFDVTNQRPVAWAQGNVVPGTCDATDQKVWTVTSAVKGLFPGLGGPGGINVHLVNGDSGAVENTILIETFPGGSLGAYGGAVDSKGNLFVTSMGPGGTLARVDRDNFVYQVWNMPQGVQPYGITVDHKGRVWVSSASIGMVGAARFDPVTETWDIVDGFWGGAGLGEGPGNLMWISSNQGVSSVDLDDFTPGPVFLTDELVKGVGFDSEGFMFAATYATEDDNGNLQGNDLLFKVDPDTQTVADYYDGLDRPYTYSDMTGYALGNVTCPPEG